MWNAVEAIKTGEAIAAVIGGNTGALMAISKLVLRMAADLERPAIVAIWPSVRGRASVLDVGANITIATPNAWLSSRSWVRRSTARCMG